MKVSADVVYFICKGFVQVMENPESHEIYKFHFPGLESLGKAKLIFGKLVTANVKATTK